MAGRPQNQQCFAFRKFVRSYMLTPEAKLRVIEAILDPEDTTTLRAAMTISAGRMDEEPPQSVSYNLTLVQTLSGLSPEALERYAETGQLPASAWTPDAAAPAVVDVEPVTDGDPDGPDPRQLVLPGFPAYPIKSAPPDA